MVVDVVQVNAATGAAQLRKVVQFVCGNALVCETIKEARSAAFDRQERIKVNLSLGHRHWTQDQFNPPSTTSTKFLLFRESKIKCSLSKNVT